MDPRSLCDLAIMLFSLGRALRPPLWKLCIRYTNYRRLTNYLEKSQRGHHRTIQNKQTLPTDRNWLITGRTPFKSDSHFSGKLTNSFKGQSCNVPLINNCSLESDDFHLGQSVVSTTNIYSHPDDLTSRLTAEWDQDKKLAKSILIKLKIHQKL